MAQEYQKGDVITFEGRNLINPDPMWIDRVFPHVCAGDGCRVCWWVRTHQEKGAGFSRPLHLAAGV